MGGLSSHATAGIQHSLAGLRCEQLGRQLRALVLAGKKLVPAEGEWYPGRPVLITENDYQLNLFNGDDGVVLPSVRDGGGLRVFFHEPGGGGVRSLHPARLPAHETMFAMTIH